MYLIGDYSLNQKDNLLEIVLYLSEEYLEPKKLKEDLDTLSYYKEKDHSLTLVTISSNLGNLLSKLRDLMDEECFSLLQEDCLSFINP